MDIPFSKGDLLREKHDPAKMGRYTGKRMGPDKHVMLRVEYLDGKVSWRPLAALELVKDESLDQRLIHGPYGRADDLRRVTTYEKLKGALHNVIYSMFASEIEFHPHQYKPVLKMIDSPTERLILADEVGLGKTIESALVWQELRARKGAKRLLVMCPKTLANKWEKELTEKFRVNAKCVDFGGFKKETLKAYDYDSHEFALIVTYSGLRPPKEECDLLNAPSDEGGKGSEKVEFLRRLRERAQKKPVFDLLVFDEAHYMRNPGTAVYKLGRLLSACSDAVLCVSATPINNTNKDLHSLLQFVDEDFFGNQSLFEEHLQNNIPAVRAGNILARTPLDKEALAAAVRQMGEAPRTADLELYRSLASEVRAIRPDDKMQVAKCQRMVETLNLLGSYVNRTRHVQVNAERPIREPMVLSLEFSETERRLYDAILRLVRERCKREASEFHRFRVLGLQLKAASCIPVLAKEIKGRLLSETEEFGEILGGEEDADESGGQQYTTELPSELQMLADRDFEAIDSKYAALWGMLTKEVPKEKVVIFAHYIATLEYLRSRLSQNGIPSAVIHGGTSSDVRWQEIERFSDPKGPRVLLSSEVGSEGIDLQFCHIIVNYDVPWNPMRLEQRIGRIDRIGQESKKLTIVNFKVANTVEERLYECLHEKLAIFERSLGDMEDIIGREIRQLTLDILSKDLSPEQEKDRMEKAQAALAFHAHLMQQLDESKDSLMGLSDHLQDQISEARGKGRYVQAEELERYLEDFFCREYKGCEVLHHTPFPHCYQIKLTHEALSDLNHFVSLSDPSHANYSQKTTLCFRNELVYSMSKAEKKQVQYESHLSPLVRWITKRNQESPQVLFNVSALRVPCCDILPKPGVYCYYVERWVLGGLTSKGQLAFAVGDLSSGLVRQGDEAEAIVQHLLSEGADWDYACQSTARENKQGALDAMREHMCAGFEAALVDFVNQNEVALSIRRQRAISFFDRRITGIRDALQTLRIKGRSPGIIRATEARLEKEERNKEAKLAELDRKAEVDTERAEVAAGIFLVE